MINGRRDRLALFYLFTIFWLEKSANQYLSVLKGSFDSRRWQQTPSTLSEQKLSTFPSYEALYELEGYILFNCKHYLKNPTFTICYTSQEGLQIFYHTKGLNKKTFKIRTDFKTLNITYLQIS